MIVGINERYALSKKFISAWSISLLHA